MKYFFLALFLLNIFFYNPISIICAEEEEVIAKNEEERVPIMREAQRKGKTTVGVEGFLIDNIFEVKIIARIHRSKPKIYNALIVGPKLGRLEIETKKELLQSTEEEEPYPITNKARGVINFSDKTEVRRTQGRLVRELVEFKIPKDKIKRNKKYKLWVQIESAQKSGKYKTFKFSLDRLPEVLLEDED